MGKFNHIDLIVFYVDGYDKLPANGYYFLLSIVHQKRGPHETDLITFFICLIYWFF